jgi:hypothetical protein
MVASAGLPSASGGADAAVPGAGPALVEIGQNSGPSGFWVGGANIAGPLAVGGSDVVGTAFIAWCTEGCGASLVSQSPNEVQFNLFDILFSGQTEGGANITGACNGTLSASEIANASGVGGAAFPTVNYQLTCTAAVGSGPDSSFSLDIEGSEAAEYNCFGVCVPAGYGVYTMQPT